MSDEKIFVANSKKYPDLIGQTFDISKGIFILIKHGQIIAQGDNSFKLIDMVMNDKSNLGDDHAHGDNIQLVNLLFVRADRYFQQVLHCTSNGLGLTTSGLLVKYFDSNGIEQNENRHFLLDTGASMSCIPEPLNPFKIQDIFIDVETGGGIKRQHLTRIELTIDEYSYDLIACITQAQSFILGMDVLKFYTIYIDGDKSGVLIKNTLNPNN